ncbi:MAG: hypothetical protein ACP5VQ_05770, partial [Phycisphaerae bacterium]
KTIHPQRLSPPCQFVCKIASVIWRGHESSAFPNFTDARKDTARMVRRLLRVRPPGPFDRENLKTLESSFAILENQQHRESIMTNPAKKSDPKSRRKTKIDDWERNVLPILTDLSGLAPKLQVLSLREQIIFAAAVLDAGLVRLIGHRLNGPLDEINNFLGTAGKGDSRAPCGSFGSRIQLARLVGVITAEDAELLREVKDLRNHVAHAVEIELESKAIAEGLLAIYTLFKPVRVQNLVFMELAQRGNSPLMKQVEKTHPAGWRILQAKLDQSRQQWQEGVVQPCTEIYEGYLKTGKIKPTETPVTVILSSGMEALLSNGDNIKMVANLLFLAILGYYRTRFDSALRNMKPVDLVAEPFSLLSPAPLAEVPEAAKE